MVDVAEDKIEVVVGTAIDGPCPGVVDDVLQNHCMAKASGSTPGLAVAYLRLVEGSCTTLESRMAAYGGYGFAVVGRTDWIVRA